MDHTDTPFDVQRLRIATPCTKGWDNMAGDHRTRFCGDCRKNVYNVTQLTRREVEDLIYANEGKVCMHLHRRADGTVMTADCKGGMLDSPRRRALKRRLAGALALAALLAGVSAQAEDKQYASTDPEVEALRQKLLKEAQARIEATAEAPAPPSAPGFGQGGPQGASSSQRARESALQQVQQEAEAQAAAEEQAHLQMVQQELKSCDMKKVKVGKTDTLDAIAKAHNSKVDWILVANKGLTEANLSNYGSIKVPISRIQAEFIDGDIAF